MIIVSILIFIVILSVLIAIHEFGHFISAKLSGIRVSEFAIGMGPKLWSKQKGETLYSIRILPIGGFCNMSEDEETDPSDIHAFSNAKRRRRAIVLSAGSIMNFMLGFLLLLGLNLSYPAGSSAFIVPEVTNANAKSSDPSWEQQLKKGDRILKINGHAIYTFNDVRLFSSMRGDGPYEIKVLRAGKHLTLPAVYKSKFPTEDGNMSEDSYLGIDAKKLKPATFGNRIINAWYDSIGNVRLVWVSLGELIGGRTKMTELTGPVGMANVVNSQVQAAGTPVSVKVMNILGLTALISINLAVMNLLPIPRLDGSRLIFLAIEGVRRKKMNPTHEGYIHAAGMLLLFGLMIFIFFNDIMKWVTGSGFGE